MINSLGAIFINAIRWKNKFKNPPNKTEKENKASNKKNSHGEKSREVWKIQKRNPVDGRRKNVFARLCSTSFILLLSVSFGASRRLIFFHIVFSSSLQLMPPPRLTKVSRSVSTWSCSELYFRTRVRSISWETEKEPRAGTGPRYVGMFWADRDGPSGISYS